MTVRTLIGDCREILPTLDAESFDCIVTSPPYWGLRDYGHAGQIGLEPTLDEYIEAMAGVSRELWRVLKPTGTFWLNLGDCYNAHPGQRKVGDKTGEKQGTNNGALGAPSRHTPGLKPKDLCLVPERVALRIQADGWWIRKRIIWAKPNPMPESVTDRPTSAHEHVWFLTKAERYFYDAAAIAEPAEKGAAGSTFHTGKTGGRTGGERTSTKDRAESETRNARDVWTIASQPYRGAHFATMPPALAERCIKAGCPAGGQVLDPFGGAGTTGLVADRLGRHATLIELNPAYHDLQHERIAGDSPLFAEVV